MITELTFSFVNKNRSSVESSLVFRLVRTVVCLFTLSKVTFDQPRLSSGYRAVVSRGALRSNVPTRRQTTVPVMSRGRFPPKPVALVTCHDETSNFTFHCTKQQNLSLRQFDVFVQCFGMKQKNFLFQTFSFHIALVQTFFRATSTKIILAICYTSSVIVGRYVLSVLLRLEMFEIPSISNRLLGFKNTYIGTQCSFNFPICVRSQ